MDSDLQLQKRIEILEARLSVNAEGGYRPTQFEYETEVPMVSDLRVVGTQNEGSWAGALTWIEPQNKDISGYEIWAQNVNDESSGWVKKGEVTQPPWSDNIVTSDALTVQFSVRTKLRNGLGNTVTNSPTVPVSILAPSVSITDPSQVGPNVIGDSAFLRTGGDAIAIANADIISLQATKITAGTLVAGVIYANAIAASQISAGTISVAMVLTSPDIQSTSGSSFARLNGGTILSYGTLGHVTTSNGVITVATHSGGTPTAVSTVISPTSIIIQDASADIAATLQDVGSGNGRLILTAGGTTSITLTGSTGTMNLTGAYQMDGADVINSSKVFVGAAVDVAGDVDFGDELRQNGTLIVNSSGAFVGAGVDVGSNGVGCGGVNISGGHTGQTVTFNAFPTQMVFRGGVLTGYTP